LAGHFQSLCGSGKAARVSDVNKDFCCAESIQRGARQL